MVTLFVFEETPRFSDEVPVPALYVHGGAGCGQSFRDIAAILEPDSENPILVIAKGLGIDGVETILRMLRQRRGERAGPLFPIGELRLTAGAAAHVPAVEWVAALNRHLRGDWGELDRSDAAQNRIALAGGERLLSRYVSGHRVYYIITEADRSATIVLLADEY